MSDDDSLLCRNWAGTRDDALMDAPTSCQLGGVGGTIGRADLITNGKPAGRTRTVPCPLPLPGARRNDYCLSRRSMRAMA